jgi:hypothetical protein
VRASIVSKLLNIKTIIISILLQVLS